MGKKGKMPDMNLPIWFDGQNINEALCFHKTVIQSIIRCLWCIPHFPIFQQMQIIRQRTKAQHFVLPELSDIRVFRLWQGCVSKRFRVKTKIRSQFLRCL